MAMDYLVERLKTIRNLVDVSLWLREEKQMEVNISSPLATLLELILLEAQEMTDDYCVVRDD